MAKKSNKSLIIAGFFGLVFLVALFEFLSKGFLVQWDLAISQAVPTIQVTSLLLVSKLIDVLLGTISIVIVSLVICLFIIIGKSERDALFFAAVMLLMAAFVYVIKEIVQRVRPEDNIIAISGYSFPSGHACTAVVFFGLLTYLAFKQKFSESAKWSIFGLAILFSLLTGFSRIYLNVHYLSDVIAGFALGGLILFSGIYVYELYF